ncbi:MAG: hypothetical protein K2F71_06970, partial [Paramuribaculum sp.]|nr:hypothetical protein [Paramuribaculum sp.]
LPQSMKKMTRRLTALQLTFIVEPALKRRGAVYFLRLDPPMGSGEDVLYFVAATDGSSLTLADSTLQVKENPGFNHTLVIDNWSPDNDDDE